MENSIDKDDFSKLSSKSIAEIVKKFNAPKCVAVMLDGTRRVLKLDPKYHSDKWLYYEDHIRNLILKSVEIADTLFDMGVENIVGPLASYGNLHRKDFMPVGLSRLLEPLLEEYPMSVIKKHNLSISLYGDLEYAKSMPGGEIISKYQKIFNKLSSSNSKKKILIGIGFSTDRETTIISNLAIDFYQKHNKKPRLADLIKLYFGTKVHPVDIFIRTNEIRSSGGLTPLLTSHDTQFYFPVSPGIISLSKNAIKTILHDYLFNRNISHGTYEHQPITSIEAKKIKKIYFDSKDVILGVGQKVGDLWLHKEK